MKWSQNKRPTGRASTLASCLERSILFVIPSGQDAGCCLSSMWSSRSLKPRYFFRLFQMTLLHSTWPEERAQQPEA